MPHKSRRFAAAAAAALPASPPASQLPSFATRLSVRGRRAFTARASGTTEDSPRESASMRASEQLES